jgi:hypothetical protein
MIQLILIAAGIFILAKGKVDVSSKKELVRPKSAIVASILIVIGLLMTYIKLSGAIEIILSVSLVATVFISYLLAEEKSKPFAETEKNKKD